MADHPIGGGAAYLQNIGGFIERHFAALGSFAFAINRNTVGVPKTTDMGSCPGGAASVRLAGAIQDGGDCHVRQLSRQYPHEIDNIGLDRPTGLSDLVLLDRHLGVVATLPMNDKCQAVVDNIDDDFFDEQPDDLLARLNCCTGTIPCLG